MTVQDGGISGKDVYLTSSRIPFPLDTEVDDHAQNVRAERKLVLRDVIAGGIAAGDAPKLVRSPCMQSFKLLTPGDWGVCTLD